ncbi:glutamate synthase subunit alpha, partial [bacterium]
MVNKEKLAQFGLYDPRFEHDSCGVGFVCNIKGKQSNEIIRQGLEVLRRLAHRGATGADPKTGDGAGILFQMPHEFLAAASEKSGIKLPDLGNYGTGLVFLPRDPNERAFCKKTFEKIVKEEGQTVLGWRAVPVDNSDIGKTAQDTEPVIEQIFAGRGKSLKTELGFERKLYIIRKLVENEIRLSKIKQKSFFYITNLSCRTLSYKGLLMPHQVENFFLDLKNDTLKSCLCLVHSRYSTNTFPTWDLAQPFRFLAHNGEINTLRGNINWMKAREGLLKSEFFGKDLKRIYPIIVSGGSDSAMLDNVFELLMLAGRSLPHAMMMLIPSAWEQNQLLDEKVRSFYKYHTCFMEPWDGPAAIAFTDGARIGAVLDRNGLRPARYIVTKKDFVVMASEVGVLDIPAQDIAFSGRLEPGKIFFIDTQAGAIIQDEDIKQEMSRRKPYSEWLSKNVIELDKLEKKAVKKDSFETLVQMQAFGYSKEDLKFLIKPMVELGQEPVGSMGNDSPPAVLSSKPQLLFTYFKQLFAQVTNPAIDPIREELVMSLETYLGPSKNIFEETPQHCHKLLARRPILTNEELETIKAIKKGGFKTKTISLLFKVSLKEGFAKTLEQICKEAAKAIQDGYTFIILSDRGVDKEHAAIPALLAVAAVHHHLVRNSLRTQISIILESAEPREVHHFGLLFGYGADCVNPYLGFKAVEYLVTQGEVQLDIKQALYNYVKAINKGILKILSKMGISTLQSYRGAQIFEALGLHEDVINNYFPGTVSRIAGVRLEEIARETILRHRQAYPGRITEIPQLTNGGLYQWRRDGEFHLWNPESVAALQDACRNND